MQRLHERVVPWGVQVLGVSSDRCETHQRFAEEKGLGYTLVCDGNSVLQRHFAPGRVTYVIGQDGVVCSLMKGQPNLEILYRAVCAALKKVSSP